MTRSRRGLTAAVMSSRSGASASSSSAWRVLMTCRGGAGPRLFPPHVRAEVIAMACALPAERGVPLSRWSAAELAREAVGRGIVEQISGVTVWRWLSADAIKPWQHRSWIFPRDPPVRREGRPGARPLPGPLARRAAASGRLRRLRRREALDPSQSAQAPDAARPTPRAAEGRARVRAQGRATWPAGTSSRRGSSTAARPRTGSSRSTRLSTSSCPSTPTSRRSACS
jgi:hypothetical protein